jgi:Tol biopolymer transport system component
MIDRCTPTGPHGLVLFSFATGKKQCLTAPDSANEHDYIPALSPDGKTVAFARGTSAAVAELYTVPLSGARRGASRRTTM